MSTPPLPREPDWAEPPAPPSAEVPAARRTARWAGVVIFFGLAALFMSGVTPSGIAVTGVGLGGGLFVLMCLVTAGALLRQAVRLGLPPARAGESAALGCLLAFGVTIAVALGACLVLLAGGR